MPVVRDLSTSDAVFKSVINNTLSDEWKSRRHLHDHGGLTALEAIRKDQVEQLNKIKVAATAKVLTKKPQRNGKCEIVCKYGSRHLYICRSVPYIDLLLCRGWHLCDFPCGVYTLLRLISIARYVFLSLLVFGFEGQSLKYSVKMFRNEVDN